MSFYCKKHYRLLVNYFFVAGAWHEQHDSLERNVLGRECVGGRTVRERGPLRLRRQTGPVRPDARFCPVIKTLMAFPRLALYAEFYKSEKYNNFISSFYHFRLVKTVLFIIIIS